MLPSYISLVNIFIVLALYGTILIEKSKLIIKSINIKSVKNPQKQFKSFKCNAFFFIIAFTQFIAPKIAQTAKLRFKNIQKYKSKAINKFKEMTTNYKRLMTSQHIPGQPSVNFDASRRLFMHIYENIPLETSNFQSEVNYYLNRKQSYSGNVVVVHKIKDEHITFNQGKAAMEISVVTEYIPFRLHLQPNSLNFEQALHILNGACKGFRQLLHRVRSPFVVQSNMIGVDANGEVKVWWNPLFYRSNFGFNMSSNVRLRDMVRSLIQSVLTKTNKDHANQLQKIFAYQNDTFVALQDKIRQISSNMNFKLIGKWLISNKQEYIIASKQCGLNQARNNSIMMDPLKLSSISRKNHVASTQRVILSPRKEQQRLQFNPKVITKRTYRGVSPTFQEKIQIIKSDIENLRAVVQPNKPPSNPISNSQVKLRSSRSVQNIFSYKKGITGNENIPQVSKIIKESVVIGQNEDLTISRFIDPISKSATQIKGTDNCSVCNNLQELRKSQITAEKGNNDPLFLSRLQNLVGADKSIISTSRSMNESRLQKNQNNTQSKIRFGQSEKKLPQSVYFTSLFEM